MAEVEEQTKKEERIEKPVTIAEIFQQDDQKIYT